jgi:hypothetical protein
MNRKSMARVLGITVICSLTSCGLVNSHHVDAPPTDRRDEGEWWLRTTDTLPPDLLATYVAASEVHHRQGTSATYVDRQAFRTMIGGPSYERRLPAPPPDEVLGRMRERLKGCDLTRRWNTLRSVRAEACIGCTPEEADAVWQEAVETATLPNEAADGP